MSTVPISVRLPAELKEWMDEQVQGFKYKNLSAYIRHVFTELREHDLKTKGVATKRSQLIIKTKELAKS